MEMNLKNPSIIEDKIREMFIRKCNLLNFKNGFNSVSVYEI